MSDGSGSSGPAFAPRRARVHPGRVVGAPDMFIFGPIDNSLNDKFYYKGPERTVKSGSQLMS